MVLVLGAMVVAGAVVVPSNDAHNVTAIYRYKQISGLASKVVDQGSSGGTHLVLSTQR